MATETLVLKLQAGESERKLKAYQQSLTKTEVAAEKLQATTRDMNGRLRDAKGRFVGTGKAADTATGGIKRLIGVVGKLALAYGAFALAQKSLQAGISRAESERRIGFLAKEYGEVTQLQNAASAAAKKFGASQTEANKALANIYGRLRPIGTELTEIVSVYNGFNTAARLSGASATEASNAFTQLAQGLGSGALRGDEFNSIAEQVPGILTAISKETGIAQGNLRDFAATGGITADIVINALKRIEKDGAEQLEEALGGPAQSIKDFQNASEEVMVALTQTIVPEMADAFRTLADVIYALETPIKYIGQLLGGLLSQFNKVLQLQNLVGADKKLGLGAVALTFGAESEALDQFADGLDQIEPRFAETKDDLKAITAQVERFNLQLQRIGPNSANVDRVMRLQRTITSLNNEIGGRDGQLDRRAKAPGIEKPTPTPTSAKGGGKTTARGGQATTNRVPQLQAELALEQQLFMLQVQINQAELVSDQKLAAELALKQNLLEIEAQIAKVQAGKGTEAEKLVQIAMLQIKLEEEKLDAAHSIAMEEKERVESYKELMEGMDREIELLEEKDGWAKELLKIEQEILDLKKEGLLVTQKEIDAYREKRKEKAEAEGKKGGGKIKAYMDQLKAELGDTEGMIVSLAQTVEAELGNAMSNAITGLITGTKTAEEAFSEMFANIGKAFIDMATQMIAKALIMKALGVLMPGAGGGGGGFTPTGGWGNFGPKFADGGFVTSPTQATVGEGGDDEYVIPSSKMESSMARWNSGMRGESVVAGANASYGGDGQEMVDGNGATNVNISGGVLKFNDEDYIKAGQVPAIINQASAVGEKRALRKLQMSPGTRRKVGI